MSSLKSCPWVYVVGCLILIEFLFHSEPISDNIFLKKLLIFSQANFPSPFSFVSCLGICLELFSSCVCASFFFNSIFTLIYISSLNQLRQHDSLLNFYTNLRQFFYPMDSPETMSWLIYSYWIVQSIKSFRQGVSYILWKAVKVVYDVWSYLVILSCQRKKKNFGFLTWWSIRSIPY